MFACLEMEATVGLAQEGPFGFAVTPVPGRTSSGPEDGGCLIERMSIPGVKGGEATKSGASVGRWSRKSSVSLESP